jgi:hypothetical protein
MMFEDLKFEKDDLNGIAAFHLFPNHYGVSVVKNPYSYGGREGKYELAILVMKPSDEYSELCYDASIANDIIGHLSEQAVTDIMQQVSKLPTRE